jgi:hypothetical protein
MTVGHGLVAKCIAGGSILGMFVAPSVVFSGCLAVLAQSSSGWSMALLIALLVTITVLVAAILRRVVYQARYCGMIEVDSAAIASGLLLSLGLAIGFYWRL